MSIRGKPSPRDAQPIRKKTGKMVYAPPAPPSRLRPSRRLIRPQTGPWGRAPEADAGPGSILAAATHRHIRRRAKHPGPALTPQSP